MEMTGISNLTSRRFSLHLTLITSSPDSSESWLDMKRLNQLRVIIERRWGLKSGASHLCCKTISTNERLLESPLFLALLLSRAMSLAHTYSQKKKTQKNLLYTRTYLPIGLFMSLYNSLYFCVSSKRFSLLFFPLSKADDRWGVVSNRVFNQKVTIFLRSAEIDHFFWTPDILAGYVAPSLCLSNSRLANTMASTIGNSYIYKMSFSH